MAVGVASAYEMALLCERKFGAAHWQVPGQAICWWTKPTPAGAAYGSQDSRQVTTPSEGKLPPNMAKVYPAEMARRVTVNAMQVLGGAGYMKDYPAEKYVRDAMVLPIISGANEVLKYFMSMKL
jgi:alkylation response protein AidB-like acyl-CoA dehydrogenase